MTRQIGFLILALAALSTPRAYAQDLSAGPGQAEVAIIPVGAMLFTESKDASAPSFGNYQLGGAVAYNINRFVGIEGEVGSTVGISQSLDFGYPSSVRTPDMLSYRVYCAVLLNLGR